MSDLTTPRMLAPHVLDFCVKVSPNQQPIYLPAVPPELGELPLECFENSRLRAERHGGEIVHGWVIWEWPRVMIEGEFHAVWRQKDGHLVDVTPRKDAEKKILFLPQPSRAYEEMRVDNVRSSLSSDPAVTEYIAAAEEFYRVRTRGARIFQRLPDIPSSEWRSVYDRMLHSADEIRRNLKRRKSLTSALQRTVQSGRL